MRRLQLYVFSTLLFAAVVFGQANGRGQLTSGNYTRLGQSTVVDLPASSAAIKGVMGYNLDGGVPVYNTGTAWVDLAVAGASSGTGMVTLDSGIASTFTTAAATAGQTGILALNTTTGDVILQNSATTYTLLSAPWHQNRQTMTTYIPSAFLVSTSPYPAIVERIYADGSFNTVQSRTESVVDTRLSTVDVGRPYIRIRTSTAEQGWWHPANSANPTVFLAVTNTDSSPAYCQRTHTDTDITSQRMFVGLAAAKITVDTATMDQTGAAFRYDTSVDGLLYLCSRDSTTQSCTSTGITVATSTAYHMCMWLDSSRVVWGWVNGVYVATQSANLPVATTDISPFVHFKAIGAVQRTINIAQMQLTQK